MDKLVQYIKRIYLRIKYRRYGWHGNYRSWTAAAANCGGYHAANILDKVKTAALQVKEGKAVYERDGKLYDQIQLSWPLLTNLLLIAGKNDQRLSVIDFGGALGSTYFQNRQQLAHLRQLQWSIIDQPGFVEAGKTNIADSTLDFFYSLEEAEARRGPHQVLLLSCVLPYLEDPYGLLADLLRKKIPYIIIENTYFNPASGNRLTVQKVPPFYYEAAYPAWFLDYQQVVDTLQPGYQVLATYNNEDILYLDGRLVNYKGCVLQLKTGI